MLGSYRLLRQMAHVSVQMAQDHLQQAAPAGSEERHKLGHRHSDHSDGDGEQQQQATQRRRHGSAAADIQPGIQVEANAGIQSGFLQSPVHTHTRTLQPRSTS